MCACVRACVRACVCVCVYACIVNVQYFGFSISACVFFLFFFSLYTQTIKFYSIVLYCIVFLPPTTSDTQLRVLFPRRRPNIITQQQTHSQESCFQDCGRTLLQITRQQTQLWVLIPIRQSNIITTRKLLQITRQQSYRSVNSKTAVEHYYKTHDNRHTGVLFPRRRSNIITNHTTKDTQLWVLIPIRRSNIITNRTLLQITRTHRSLICKTAVQHYYKSHNNRHTALSLISKTAVQHYYKSHDNRHTGVIHYYKAHDNFDTGVLYPRRRSNIITNHTTTDTQES